MMINNAGILQKIVVERYRQEELREKGKFQYSCATAFGLTEAEKLGVLAEEFGEVAQHVCKHRIPNPPHFSSPYVEEYREHLREELIQVAAVCVAWVEALDKEDES